jgi:hypothetical protein
MHSASNFVDDERLLRSELARLSSDPTLALHPDPRFRAKFRNPDETDDIVEQTDFTY